LTQNGTPEGPAKEGGPRQRDAERSRRAILDAACREFAMKGLDGARIGQIAESAQVDKKLIFYYFRNKEGLYRAALRRSYAHIREEESRLHLAELPPEQAIRRLTEFTWVYYLQNPEFLGMLNTENQYGAVHLRQDEEIRSVNSPLIEMLEDILARGAAAGVFRPGVDAVQLYISIAGLAYFYLSNNATLSAIFGRDLKAPAALDERLAHICDLVVAAVARR